MLQQDDNFPLLHLTSVQFSVDQVVNSRTPNIVVTKNLPRPPGKGVLIRIYQTDVKVHCLEDSRWVLGAQF